MHDVTEDPRAAYGRRLKSRQAELEAHRRSDRRLSAVRLIVFLGAAALALRLANGTCVEKHMRLGLAADRVVLVEQHGHPCLLGRAERRVGRRLDDGTDGQGGVVHVEVSEYPLASEKRTPSRFKLPPALQPLLVIQNGGELENASVLVAPRLTAANSIHRCPGSAFQS